MCACCSVASVLTIPRYVMQVSAITSRLLKAGVRIYEYQPRFLHLKTALVDDWVSLGSCNFDHWTLHWNLEANQQVVDAKLVGEVAESFDTDFQQSKEWTLAQWRELPWQHRLKIRVWGQIKPSGDAVV